MRKLSLIAILCLVPLTSGCLAAAGLTVGAVIGYVYYDKNEANKDYQESFDKTWKATLEAMETLKYAVPKAPEHSADFGEFKVDDVKIRVARHANNMTRVSIRVGTFDTAEHRRKAALIFEKIDDEL